jgi:NTP pyrophosphatase (non-canonical NTP hydrolase)
MSLPELQQLIRDLFGAKDARRGVEGTFMWFMEEVGELAAALRGGSRPDELAAEFADVLAWLATLANIAGVDLAAAVAAKYGAGCPRCGESPCRCGAPKP